ncbi:hypothetical protein FJ366_01335 [Candidatus Dependentiae bacterium]|nr:hypothetical protein [Candidatus Dependentiae bacterium]
MKLSFIKLLGYLFWVVFFCPSVFSRSLAQLTQDVANLKAVAGQNFDPRSDLLQFVYGAILGAIKREIGLPAEGAEERRFSGGFTKEDGTVLTTQELEEQRDFLDEWIDNAAVEWEMSDFVQALKNGCAADFRVRRALL